MNMGMFSNAFDKKTTTQKGALTLGLSNAAKGWQRVAPGDPTKNQVTPTPKVNYQAPPQTPATRNNQNTAMAIGAIVIVAILTAMLMMKR
ncbi:hypothetical protein BKI52_02505 [marine bacterium AO1-C]|nr:hypothetical protein BKI52_02505 [marine bacterium AO1-C]